MDRCRQRKSTLFTLAASLAGACSVFCESSACARHSLYEDTCSGPLPSAQYYSAPFFLSLTGFNASYNRLSGTIPTDWARTAIFDAAVLTSRREDFFFDVRSNALTGALPSFFPGNAPARLDPVVRTEVRRSMIRETFKILDTCARCNTSYICTYINIIFSLHNVYYS